MKRLKKENEFYDGYKVRGHRGEDYNGQILEVFVNPTSKEVSECDQFSPGAGIRLFLHEDGKVYVWNGDILHGEIEKHFSNIKSNIGISSYNGQVQIYLKGNVTPEMLKETFKNCMTNLAQCSITPSSVIEDLDTNWYGSSDNYEQYNDIKTVQDILDIKDKFIAV